MNDAIEPPPISDPVERVRGGAKIGLQIGCLIYLVGMLGVAIPDPSWYRTLRTASTGCPDLVDIGSSQSDTPPGEAATRDALHEGRDRLPYWFGERVRLAEDCARSYARQCKLQQIVDQPTAPGFSDAARRIDDERVRYTGLREREQRLTLGGYDLGARIVLGFIDLLVAWLTVRGLLRSGTQIVRERHAQILARWRSVQHAILAFGVVVTVVTLCLTIDPEHKISIGSDSWVVCPWTWGSTLVSMIGVVAIFSVPATLLWLLGARDFVPTQVQPLASDGQCGVGDYVSFLHIWTILACALGLVPTVLWIRHMSAPGTSFVFAYLIPVIAGQLLIATLAARLVYNATVLRRRYRDAIQRIASTWAEIEAVKPAPDPTIPFIGENWWKLPATLGALLLAIWQVLEWTGASRAILGTIGG
jgi:hypothetical protein